MRSRAPRRKRCATRSMTWSRRRSPPSLAFRIADPHMRLRRNLPEVKMLDQATRTRQVLRLSKGQPTSDGAGVRLNRVIGNQSLSELDPFLLLDEFRSEDGADYIGGFPDHPHRGFETVTYMLAGRMRHGDNKGHSGLLRPGSEIGRA